MTDRNKRAHRLMSALGGISDVYLDEAQCYKPRRKIRASVLIAACLTLSVLIVVGAVGAMNIAFKDKSDNARPSDVRGLDGILCEAVSSGSMQRVSSQDLPIKDGEAYIVVQLNWQDDYYISDSLTFSQSKKISSNMGGGEDVGDTSPTLECSLWVILGDGTVISPYLKLTEGNVGVDIFDYSAEIYPTEGFNAIVSEILQ